MSEAALPAAASAPDPQTLNQAQALAQRLSALLDLEFESLKQQDLARFESLQAGKTELLQALAQHTPEPALLQTLAECAPLWESLAQCRDAHRRNAVLIERQLEVVRNALQALSQATGTSSVEVYDRLGQVARFQRGRGYQEA